MPGSGKSTVFQALTCQAVQPQFLGLSFKPNQAVVKIPDKRLGKVGELWKTRNVVYATMEFIDIPGFDPADTDARLKKAVLEHYRQCDALALVVNLFDPAKAGEAAKGVQLLLDELTLLGLVMLEKVVPRLRKMAEPKTAKEERARYELICRVKDSLEEGIPLRRMELNAAEEKRLREYALLSGKGVIALLNLADGDFSKPDSEIMGLAEIMQLLQAEGIGNVRLSAQVEAELRSMETEEAAEFMAEYGITEPALDRFISEAFKVLGLKTFLTGSEKECRSWSAKSAANALECAGVIHSDMARGFIRAETVAFADLVENGGLAGAKAAGKVRLEGKEYLVKDGDILNIRFNV